MNGVKITKIWKYMCFLFLLLGCFLIVSMPSSNEPSAATYFYLFLTITLTVIGVALVFLPLGLIIWGNEKRTTIQKVLWVMFIVIFNIVGSYISYFWLREVDKNK